VPASTKPEQGTKELRPAADAPGNDKTTKLPGR
jgi:hypothetical protein